MEKEPQAEESSPAFVVSKEISQTGPTSTPPPSPAPSTPPDSPTMGDEKVSGSQQTVDDHDSTEVDAKGATNPGIDDKEIVAEEQEGLQRLQSGLTFNLTKEEPMSSMAKPLSTIIEDEDDDDDEENISPDDVITAEKKPVSQFRKSTKVLNKSF
jgi:hypothetical protein